MFKTLVLLFHPDLKRSTANAALARAAAQVPNTTVIDAQSLYPHGRVDADAEVARLLGADRIVLQFPVQWYAPPPLLKAWQDEVLTRMFYIRYEAEGRLLEGKPLMIAATASNTLEAYAATGANRFPLEELLRPLEATAHRCGLKWLQPYLMYRADKLSAPDIAAAAAAYADRLAPVGPMPPDGKLAP